MKITNISNPKRRRGLSSIVGALLFVVLMVSAFAVIGVALNSQTDIASTGRDVAAKDLEKQQEDFSLSKVQQLPAGFLTVELFNKGQNRAEMFTMIMTNKSDAGEPTRTFEIPSETSFLNSDPTNIVATLDLKMDTPAPTFTEDYDFKVISSLGTVKETSVTCDDTGLCGTVAPLTGPAALSSQLFLDGPAGVNTKPTTVVMFVQNIGEVPLEDVYPVNACPSAQFPIVQDLGDPETIPGDFLNCNLDPDPDPACGAGTGICLAPGQTVLFQWDGIVSGDVGDVFTFCNNVQGEEVDNTPVGPTPLDCDEIIVINPNDCGGAQCDFGGEGGESIILIDDLLIRPSIFMTLPSPFGDTDGTDTGLWALNLANPTDEPMTISKVTILAYPPGGNAQDVVFQGKGVGSGTNNCLVQDIEPNKGTQPQGYWECPRDNILMWQSITDPVLLEANSTQSFVARVTPYTIKTNFDNLDALIVQGNVYSTFGSFGKSGYQSSMYDADGSIVNVYLTNSTDPNDRDVFINNINNMANYTVASFKAVLADMDNSSDTVIETQARLIINVPREWTEVNLVSCDGFDSNDGDGDCNDPPIPTVVQHSDGSTQIIGTTSDVIGDGVNDARAIEFTARSAPVKAPRLFVMYILADGEVINTQNQTKTIGPLHEAILNVDP